jgi:hypothetical protein
MRLGVDVLDSLTSEHFLGLLAEISASCSDRIGKEAGQQAVRFLWFLAHCAIERPAQNPAVHVMARPQESLLVVTSYEWWLVELARDALEVGFRLGVRHAETRAREAAQLRFELELVPERVEFPRESRPGRVNDQSGGTQQGP